MFYVFESDFVWDKSGTVEEPVKLHSVYYRLADAKKRIYRMVSGDEGYLENTNFMILQDVEEETK